MEAVERAVNALRTATLNGKCEKKVQETVDHVISFLVLLNLSSYCPQSVKKLSVAFRRPFIPLYVAFPEEAMRLSAAIFVTIFHGKITAMKAENEIERNSWEVVQTEILSGILDFLEANETAQNKEIIAGTIYPPLCAIYFPSSPSAQIFQTRTLLRSVVYTLLHETAASHGPNQQKLRDLQLLGGKRLGIALSQTKDFLALESLLTLFARLLPSAQNNTVSGKAKRSKFIREVVDSMSGEGMTRTNELVRILETVSSNSWEHAAMKIVDIFSANISFPQPFRLDSFRACDTTFPQPALEDRLYVDQKSFFANVHQGEMCETFQTLYSQVQNIKLSPNTDNGRYETTTVTIYLSLPPLVGDLPMNPPDKGHPITFTFDLQNNDVKRFIDSLRSRGLYNHVKQIRQKISKASSSTALEFDISSHTIPPPPVEGKVKAMERIVDDLGSDSHPSSDGPQVVEVPTPPDLAAPSDLPNTTIFGVAGEVTTETCGLHTSTPLPITSGLFTNEGPSPLHSKPGFHCDAVFGASSEVLSEISVVTGPSPPPSKATGNDGVDHLPNVDLTKVAAAQCDTSPSINHQSPVVKTKSRGRNVLKKRIIILDSDSDMDTDAAKIPTESMCQQPVAATRNPLPARPHVEIDLTKGRKSTRRTKSRDGPPNQSLPATMDEPAGIKHPAKTSVESCGATSQERINNEARRSPGTVLATPVNQTTFNLDVAAASLHNSSDKWTPSDSVRHAQQTGKQTTASSVARDVLEEASDLRLLDGSKKSKFEDPLAATKQDNIGTALKRKGELVTASDPRIYPIPDSLKANGRPFKRPRKEDELEPITSYNRPSPFGPQDSEAIPHHPNEEYLSSTTHATNDLVQKDTSNPKAKSSGLPNTRLKESLDEDMNRRLTSTVTTHRALAMKRKDGKTTISTARPTVKIKAGKPVRPPPKIDVKPRRDRKHRLTELFHELPSANAVPLSEKENSREFSSSNPEIFEWEEPTMVDGPEKETETYSNISPYKAKKTPWETLELTNTFVAVPKRDIKKVIYDGRRKDIHVDLDNAKHKEVAPKKVPHAVSCASTPQEDVVVIDLTGDAPPINIITNEVLAGADDMLDHQAVSPLSVESPAQHTLTSVSLPPSRKPHHSVTFAIRDLMTRSPSPIIISNEISARKVGFAPDRSRPEYKKAPTAPTRRKKPPKRRDVEEISDMEVDDDEMHVREQERQQDCVQDIVGVLNEIHQAITRILTQKFEGVKDTVHYGRDKILQEAAADLLEISAESAGHFNKLVELEKGYKTCGSKIVKGLEDIYRVNNEIGRRLKHTVQDHDRCTLSKKFPNSLFSSPLALHGNSAVS